MEREKNTKEEEEAERIQFKPRTMLIRNIRRTIVEFAINECSRCFCFKLYPNCVLTWWKVSSVHCLRSTALHCYAFIRTEFITSSQLLPPPIPGMSVCFSCLFTLVHTFTPLIFMSAAVFMIALRA